VARESGAAQYWCIQFTKKGFVSKNPADVVFCLQRSPTAFDIEELIPNFWRLAVGKNKITQWWRLWCILFPTVKGARNWRATLPNPLNKSKLFMTLSNKWRGSCHYWPLSMVWEGRMALPNYSLGRNTVFPSQREIGCLSLGKDSSRVEQFQNKGSSVGTGGMKHQTIKGARTCPDLDEPRAGLPFGRFKELTMRARRRSQCWIHPRSFTEGAERWLVICLGVISG